MWCSKVPAQCWQLGMLQERNSWRGSQARGETLYWGGDHEGLSPSLPPDVVPGGG